MDRRLLIVLITSLITSVSQSVEFFGGLTELMKYESALPCEGNKQDKCFATNGVMGITLDTASQAGLNISSVLIHDKNNIFVKTKEHGTCLVETTPESKSGQVSFHCSQKGLHKNKLQKINKTFVLSKTGEKKFNLKEMKPQTLKKRL